MEADEDGYESNEYMEEGGDGTEPVPSMKPKKGMVIHLSAALDDIEEEDSEPSREFSLTLVCHAILG